MAKSRMLQSFYASKPWRTLRQTLIFIRGNKCEECGCIIGNPEDIIGHHTIELNDKNVLDHSISLNPELIKLVCSDCHNKQPGHFLDGKTKQVERGVYLIYGPPLAGKSSYVLEYMTPGDIVVDMDSLYEAISYQTRYDKPDSLLPNVMGVQRLLLDFIKTRHGSWRSAWIVGGYADKYKREMVIKDTGAIPVLIEATKEECLARLEGVRDNRHSSKRDWITYIEKWFEKYQP